jgi:hypothetical protein
MKNLVNTTNIRTVDILSDYPAGKFRYVSKTRSGWYTITDARESDNPRLLNNPESILTGFKKGALQTVEFCPEGGDYYLTVFARIGKTIRLIDRSILAALTVGTINQLYYNTNLYSQTQYNLVGAKTWADRAYVTNQIAGVDFSESLKQLEEL